MTYMPEPSAFPPAEPNQTPSHADQIEMQRVRARITHAMGQQLRSDGDRITDNDLREKLGMPQLDANGQPVQMLGAGFSDLIRSSGKVFVHELFEQCAALAAEYCVHQAKERLMPSHQPHVIEIQPSSIEQMVMDMSRKHGVNLTEAQQKQLADIFAHNMQDAIEQSIIHAGQTGFAGQAQRTSNTGTAPHI